MPFGTNSQHEAFRGKVKDVKGEMGKSAGASVSYTHLTLPTNREV